MKSIFVYRCIYAYTVCDLNLIVFLHSCSLKSFSSQNLLMETKPQWNIIKSESIHDGWKPVTDGKLQLYLQTV